MTWVRIEFLMVHIMQAKICKKLFCLFVEREILLEKLQDVVRKGRKGISSVLSHENPLDIYWVSETTFPSNHIEKLNVWVFFYRSYQTQQLAPSADMYAANRLTILKLGTGWEEKLLTLSIAFLYHWSQSWMKNTNSVNITQMGSLTWLFINLEKDPHLLSTRYWHLESSLNSLSS